MTKEKDLYIDVMLDIETLGNGITPVVTQISAVAFNAMTGELLEKGEFNAFINPSTGVKMGLKCDGSTVDWWLTQRPEAINRVLVKSITEGLDIQQVLKNFYDYFRKLENGRKVKFRVWGNGATFDNRIVNTLYIMANRPMPWEFYADTDMRTIVDIAVRVFNFDKNAIEFEGLKHDAIDDCKHQIKIVCAIFKLFQEAQLKFLS